MTQRSTDPSDGSPTTLSLWSYSFVLGRLAIFSNGCLFDGVLDWTHIPDLVNFLSLRLGIHEPCIFSLRQLSKTKLAYMERRCWIDTSYWTIKIILRYIDTPHRSDWTTFNSLTTTFSASSHQNKGETHWIRIGSHNELNQTKLKWERAWIHWFYHIRVINRYHMAENVYPPGTTSISIRE